MLTFFRKDSSSEAVERLHQAVVDGARRPDLFLRLGVPDTPWGRIESVMLHAMLALRRLRRLPAPAPEMAQDLVDRMFADFERALRQIGIGDLAVPKKMKALGGDWLGRIKAYAGPLDAGDETALAAALARNVLGCEGASPALPLAQHVLSMEKRLAHARWVDLQAGEIDWPAVETEAAAIP